MLPAHWILVFAGTVLLGLPTTAKPRLEQESVRPTVGAEIVRKTIISDKFRFMFLAGLEGSGHHYFRGVSKAVFTANPDLPSVDHQVVPKPFYLPFLMGESASHYAEAELAAKAVIHRLAEEAAALPAPSFYVPFRPGSYPANGGPNKVNQYGDLKLVAEASEMEGLDLRVVYLKRSAQDMVIANTIHRQFQANIKDDDTENTAEARFLEYVRIFFTDIAVLQSFLGEIDPEFVVCHDWDSLGEPLQASKIAAFVSPNDDVADMISTAMVDTVTPSHGDVELGFDALTFDGAANLVARLQDKLDSFEARYCGPIRDA